jgi:hypothetical protein
MRPRTSLGNVDKDVTYTVTFTAAWTKQTHPNPAFPNHPFFSSLIGAIHSPGVEYWKVGELGYLPFAQSGGQLLFHLISCLYEPTSVIVTVDLSHIASLTSVLRPGTFFTCAAFANTNLNSPSSKMCHTGFQ